MIIATYNAENFFDDVWPNDHQTKPDHEVDALADVVDGIGADIIAFQEVESERSLEILNNKLDRPFDYYALIRGNSERDINLGFLSRFRFYTTSHVDVQLQRSDGSVLRDYASPQARHMGQKTPMGFQRDLLLGEFSIGGGRTLAVFNVHFKSRSRKWWQDTSSNRLREAEARAARRIVRAYLQDNPQVPVLFLGDLNNTSGHYSVRPVVKNLGFSDIVKGEVPANASTYWDNVGDRIDYILLSDLAESPYVDGSGTIHNSSRARTASDHYAVSVELRL